MTSQEDDDAPIDAETEGALDAAWAALDAGDVAGARAAIAALDGELPDVLLLRAACAREEGDTASALEALERAAAAEREWATPELWIAELLADDAKTREEALKHAERALDLAEEEDEYLSALALKAGLEAELGDVDEAKETLADLPPPEVPIEDVALALEIADLYLVVDDAANAVARLRTLTTGRPDVADAWYALGCAAAELGDDEQTRAAWKRAWQLDSAPRDDADDDHLDEETVSATAEKALGELPDRARALLRDVPVIVAELPAEADVEGGLDPRALGLFSGTAYPDMPHVGGQPGLSQIVLFRRNIARVAETDEELHEEIRTTLLHEAGHFFGLDEAALEEAGLG
ncbi:MAG TPA: metallopeptidase family protein [Polyangia bacterium]|nr:metallopeptidase family protein [Polyangia bacterium]